MRKIHILATAAALLVATSAPSLAASRTHRALDAYASGAVTTDRSGAVTTDRSGAYYYGPRDAQGRAGDNIDNVQERAFVQPQYNRGQNLPYADRPYGDPDSW